MTGRIYVGARMRASLLPTRKLRRLERVYRRLSTGQPGALDRYPLAHWTAVRAELRDRGRQVPDTDVRPRRRWWLP
jgi:hypothetical protein